MLRNTFVVSAFVSFGLVSITDGATIVAVGDGGTIRHSTDDGGNWFIRIYKGESNAPSIRQQFSGGKD